MLFQQNDKEYWSVNLFQNIQNWGNLILVE